MVKSVPITVPEYQMLIEQSLNPESIEYNMNFAFEIIGNVDIDILINSLEKIVQKRTVFRSFYKFNENNEFEHFIVDSIDFDIEKIYSKKENIQNEIDKRNLPFDINNPPLWRILLIKTENSYIINLNIHHSIFDALSKFSFLQDLFKFYKGENLDNEGPDFNAYDFEDYAREFNKDNEDDGIPEFFEDMFKNGIPEVQMPTKPKRPDVLPIADSIIRKKLDLNDIKKVAVNNNVSVYELMISAFSITVGKYLNNDEILLGIPLGGRNKKARNLMGMFVRTLPLLFKPKANIRWKDYLQINKESISNLKLNQITSFENIVNKYSLDNSSSKAPIFDIVTNYLHLPSKMEIEIGDEIIEISEFETKDQELAFDIVFSIERKGTLAEISLSFSNKLYDENIVYGMMDHYLEVLNRICQKDDYDLDELGELTEEMRNLILEDFRGNQTDENRDKTFIDLFRKQATESKDLLSVVYSNNEITYKELDDLTDRIALYLIELGIKKGDVVGIISKRDFNYPIAFISVLKTGAVYIPLDPSYPEERLEFMLGDSNASLLMGHEDLFEKVRNFKGKKLKFQDFNKIANDYGLENISLEDRKVLENSAPEVDDGYILLYTSGTTGKPKGVRLSQKNIVNISTYCVNTYDLSDNDNAAAYSSFGFDASMMDMYPTLISGGTIHIIPEDMRLDLPRLNDYFNENNITSAIMTTQLGRQFVDTMDNHSIRVFNVGGEALAPIEPPEKYEFHNLYGPTECTIFITNQIVDKLYYRVPIGKPVNNTQLYIVGKDNKLCPIGAYGELCCAGRQVGDGYLNRKEKTEEVFLKNPFNMDKDYATLYRTGDIARWLPEGVIDIGGRTDHQVKIRGFRVELPEIENRIREFDSVTEVAVRAIDDPSGGKRVVAYVVSEVEVRIKDLADFIKEKLPTYMVPAAIIFVDEILLNANGKVDFRRLPSPTCESETAISEETHKLNTLEENLIEITKEIIGNQSFGIETNLIQLGLTSISAIKLLNAIDTKFGFAPKIHDLLSEPTILSIENFIIDNLVEKISKGEDLKEEKIGGYGEISSIPLTDSQIGVYLDTLRNYEDIRYNVPFELKFPNDLDIDKLISGFKTTIKNHKALLSHIETIDEDILLVKDEDQIFEIENFGNINEAKYKHLKSNFVQPFNLLEGPLFRAKIGKVNDKIIILLDFHHIIFDGISFDVFTRSLINAYENGIIDNEHHEIMTQFDYSNWEINYLQSEEFSKDKAYFEDMLKNFENSNELPFESEEDIDDINAEKSNDTFAEIVKVVNREAVDEFCKKYAITQAGVFLASTSYCISRWTQSRDVYLSTISSGRENPKLKNTVGMFVKTLPLHIELSDDEKTSLEFSNEVSQILSKTLSHGSYPFNEIVKEFGYETSIMYACELGVASPFKINETEVDVELFEQSFSKFKLSVHVEERNGEYVFALQYDKSCYSHSYIEKFGETLVQALNSIIENPDLDARHISLITPDQEKLIDSFNDYPNFNEDEIKNYLTKQNKVFIPENIKLLHERFEKVVEQIPNETALICSDAQFTYEELNNEANKLANSLIKKGVKPKDKIAFILNRNSRVLIVILGILKSGASYIPIDVEYPQKRIEHIINDSNSKFLLSTNDLFSDVVGGSSIDDDSVRGNDSSIADGSLLDIDKLLENEDISKPNVTISPNDLAYSIYTSGSTGIPKGVLIEHHSISNYLVANPKNIHIWKLVNNAKTFLSVTTVSFDMSLKEIMVSLCNGLTLVFASDDSAHDPTRLVDLFNKTNADAFNTTPSVMLEYMNYPLFLEALLKCRVIMAGGEKYPNALRVKLLENIPENLGHKIVLLNTYGPTEITVSSNAKLIDENSRITVGSPLYGYFEHVVDLDGNILPSGIVGELLISGEGVARGYNNLEKENESSFIEFEDKKAYKTGDYAKWTDDGEIEIIGRIDDQIKLNGLRIELDEIKTVLNDIPEISSGISLIRKINGVDYICAYYVTKDNIKATSIRDNLKEKLAPYMVPSAYLELDSIPMTINGKIDIKSLPEPLLLQSTEEYITPQNQKEREFSKIFAQVLGIEKVGATDNFFDLGGSSLAVTRIIIAIKDLGINNITYGDVFNNPTPRKLSNFSNDSGFDNKSDKSDDDELANFDYSQIDDVLKFNKIENFSTLEKQELGNILLSGAVGFLGIHILKHLIDNENGKIYCLMRKGRHTNVIQRLESNLFYYFEDDFSELINKKIIPIEDDITNKELSEDLKELNINTVINTAANVSHFARDDSIKKVNVEGVKNLIQLCLDQGAKLIQISTDSIAGLSINGIPSEDEVLTEDRLYFGQNLENKYINSKFTAEKEILSNITENGLDSKIMRVGNLMARSRDGEFQINLNSNSFIGKLRSFAVIGKFPYSSYLEKVTLSPIDSTAAAISLLSKTSSKFTVFHPYNNHSFYLGDLVKVMIEEGIEIEFVEDDEFEEALNTALNDKEKAEKLTSVIAYQNMGGAQKSVFLKHSNDFTIGVLLRNGWTWPQTDNAYMERFIVKLITIGYFD